MEVKRRESNESQRKRDGSKTELWCLCAEQNSVPDIMFLYALVCMCLCASSLDEESRPEKGSFSCLPAVACISTHDYPSHLHLSAQFTGKKKNVPFSAKCSIDHSQKAKHMKRGE